MVNCIQCVFFIIGLYIGLLNSTILFEPMRIMMDPVFLKGEIPSEAFLNMQGFCYGLTGACICCLSALVFFISRNAFKNKEKWGWIAIFIAIICWFIIDEPVSIIYKVYFNAIGNIVFLVAWILPLIFTRKYFFKK